MAFKKRAQECRIISKFYLHGGSKFLINTRSNVVYKGRLLKINKGRK